MFIALAVAAATGCADPKAANEANFRRVLSEHLAFGALCIGPIGVPIDLEAQAVRTADATLARGGRRLGQ